MAQLKDFSKIIHSGNEIGKVLHQGKTIWQSGPYLAQDSDFVNVNGYWVYRGSSKWVVIPTHINGELVTSTQYMFSGHSTYQATPVTKVVLNHSNVTDMSYMFQRAASTTLDLSIFDTSNVTNMYYMFGDSKATTLDLSSFDTSNVTNMGSMFMFSSATTLDLSSFDTLNVTAMSYMFRYSKATTLDLSSFNTSNLTGTFGMFDGSPATIGYARTQADANKFNASGDKPAGLNFVSPYLAQDSDFVNINGYWIYRGAELEIELPTHIEGELVTSAINMFSGDSTNQATPVTKVVLNHSNVINMMQMFYESSATTLDLSSFDTSNATNMQSMFNYSKATSLDLSNFDTSNVTNMTQMFRYSSATLLDLSSFDTSNITSMFYMFASSKATTLDLSSFNTSNVSNMNSTFRDSAATTLDLSSFDTSKVTAMGSTFSGSKATTGYARTQADANNFNASAYKPAGLNFVSPYLAQDSDFTNVSGRWIYTGAELEIEIPTHINGELVTSTQYMFSGDSTYQATPATKVVLNHSNVTDMSNMFYFSSATTLDLSNFNTTNVTNMTNMFWGSKATTLDVSSFNTSNVTNMASMFFNSKATTLDLSSFNTSKVTNMTNMFYFSSATTGYARTQTDANKFNASSSKPTGLNFVVKP